MTSSLVSVLAAHRTSLPVTMSELCTLRDALAVVPDPRRRRGVRYGFTELLAIIVSAVLSGARTLTMIAEWAEHASATRPLNPAGRVPSVATLHRTIAAVDAQTLDDVLCAWVRDQTPPARRVIAVDGKEVHGAKHGRGHRVFLLAALDHATGCVIAQEPVGTKTNEIPHFSSLLARAGNLDGVIVTADALHTQRDHAEWLHAQGAWYVFTVKHNQRALRDQIASQTWQGRRPGYTRQEKSHGRTTTWQATVQPATPRIEFPHATLTIRLTRDRHDHRTAERTREHVYAITSLPAGPGIATLIATTIRGHWGIENRLHWVRDVTYDEDRSQIRTHTAAHTMAAIRNLAISIHRLTGATNIAAATRATMRNPETARQLTGL